MNKLTRVEESHVRAGSTAHLTVLNCKLGDDEAKSVMQSNVCNVCTLYRATLVALSSKQKTSDIPRQRSKPAIYLGMDDLKQRVEDLKVDVS